MGVDPANHLSGLGRFPDQNPVVPRPRGIETARTTRDGDTSRNLYDGVVHTLVMETLHTPAYTSVNSFAALPQVDGIGAHPDPDQTPGLYSTLG